MSRPPEHPGGGDASMQILRQRARALARPRETQDAPVEMLELLEFRLGDERYAFEAAAVRDVQPLRELTPLPGTPDFLAGVANVRGRLLAMVDFKRFFGVAQRGITDLHDVLLLTGRGAGDIAIEIGLLVDAVVGVHAVPVASLQAPPLAAHGIEGGFLRGVTADRLAVLDAAAVLGDPRLIIEQDVDV